MSIEHLLDLNITNVVAANKLLKSPIGVTMHRYDRERWAVVLKAAGKTIYTCDGQETLSDSFHICVLPMGCTYTWKCIEGGECYIIEFDADRTDAKIFSCSVTSGQGFLKSFENIQRNLSLKTRGCKIDNLKELYGIISMMIKSDTTRYTSGDKKKLIAPAIEYITKNYTNIDITNEYLAKLCGISTVYFRKTFESSYGVPPMKYLQNLRMEKAKSMLLSDFGSISQVAESVGYSSIYHFSKMFKQYTGESPGKFAKKR